VPDSVHQRTLDEMPAIENGLPALARDWV